MALKPVLIAETPIPMALGRKIAGSSPQNPLRLVVNNDKAPMTSVLLGQHGHGMGDEEDELLELAKRRVVDPARATTLAAKFQQAIDEINEAALPEGPERDFDSSSAENLFDYIRSHDGGLGPWLDARKLTRSFMKHQAPKAYWALVNWLRDKANTLPDDIIIRRKIEVSGERAVDKDAIREGWRRAKALQRNR